MSTEPLLELHDVNLVYRALPALRDINWRPLQGQQWACLGPNGAGKTSLARVLCSQATHYSGDFQRAPLLDGDLVVWLDESTRPPTLRSFDLQTGRAQAVVQAPIRPGDYDLAGSVVVWVADEGDGPALYHHRLDRP